MNLDRLFRIFYVAFYAILTIVLVVLLLITPADAIHQAWDHNQKWNVIVILICYFVTIVFAIGTYTVRILTTKSVLKAIPKTWIPVEKGDVKKRVRKMIAEGLNRSAAITWDSRPQVAPNPATIVSEPDARDAVARVSEPGQPQQTRRRFFRARLSHIEDEITVAIPPHLPVWGEIAHNGWSSPTSPDLPNLQYITVILELPHLIEAKAVSLGPIDADSTSDAPIPDIRAVDLLQRPASMGLRDYITHLTSVGIITSVSTATEFLVAYEYARFSSKPLSEHEFRDLMKQFSEVLRSMKPLNPAVLESLDIDPPESDIDGDASSSSTPVTPRSRSIASSHSPASRSSSEGTIRTAPSRRIFTNGTTTNRPSEFSTAPATPKSKKRGVPQSTATATPQSMRRGVSRSSSFNKFAQSRPLYGGSTGTSSSSLRSTSQSSVIKLRRTTDEDALPYTLSMPPVQ